jgi:hypothetical protein
MKKDWLKRFFLNSIFIHVKKGSKFLFIKMTKRILSTKKNLENKILSMIQKFGLSYGSQK